MLWKYTKYYYFGFKYFYHQVSFYYFNLVSSNTNRKVII